MKKKMIIMMLCTMLLAAMSTNAFALEIDYDQVSIPNDGTYEDVVVDYSKEGGAGIYASNYIKLDFPKSNQVNKAIVRISADADTYVGTGTVEVIYYDEDNEIDSSVVYVNVYDASKPENLNASKSGNYVKLTWENTRSYYYQIQYRTENGKWKTAASKYNIAPKIQTEGRAYTFKNLKKGKTYQFRLRPVTPCYEWGTKYGKWSEPFTYTVK